MFRSATYGEICSREVRPPLKQDVHDDHAEHGVAELCKTFCAAVLGIVRWRRAVPVRLTGEDIKKEVSLDGGECWDVVHLQAAIDER